MEYRKYLSRIRLWNIRSNFDINRIKLIENNFQNQNYANEINSQLKKYEHNIFCPNPMWEMSIAVAHSTPNPIHKPDNNKYLPYCKWMNQITCGVCHKPMDRINPLYKANMSIVHNQPDNKSMKKSKSQQLFNQSSDNMILIENIKLNFAEWFTWCHTCKHVSHLEHAEEWFQSHTECPIPDCGCSCKLQSQV